MNKFYSLLKSRKFWAAIIGLIVLVLGEYGYKLILDPEQLTGFITIIAAYIIGTAIEGNGS